MGTAAPKNCRGKSYTFNSPAIVKALAPNQTKMVCWDVIGKCKGEECGIASRCIYLKGIGLHAGEKDPDLVLGSCLVQKKYLDNVYEGIIGNLVHSITPEQSIRIGLTLMPLFGNLVKMKIEEASQDTVILKDKNSKNYANPVYKEIRETIKVINYMMSNLNIEPMGDDIPEPDFTNGDPTYYERMMDVPLEKGTLNEKRRYGHLTKEERKREKGHYTENDHNDLSEPAASRIAR